MSISVGKGFIPVESSVKVSDGGDNNNDGLTAEKPVATMSEGIAKALSGGKSAVSVSGGTFFENVVMQPGVRLDASSSVLTSSTPSTTVLEAASTSPAALGFLSGSASNQIIYSIDGKSRALLLVDTFVMGTFFGPLPTGVVGISITGSNDDIPIGFINGEVRADSSTLISFTGTSNTPPQITLGSFTNFGDNIKLCEYNPSDPNQRCTIIVSWEDDLASAITGTELFVVDSGILNVIAPGGLNVPGKTIATVNNGGRFGLANEAVSGNIVVNAGGEYQVSALGLQIGNLTLNGSGNIFQNELTGDLIIGASGVFDGIIGKVGGTVSIDQTALDNANVNGIINGVAYGTYKNPSFNYDFSRQNNTNNGSYFRSESIQTSSAYGPLAVADLVPEVLTWINVRSDAGTLEVWSNGSRFGTVTKPFGFAGFGFVVPDTTGDFIPIGATIAIRWVSSSGSGRLRNTIVNLNCRRHG